MHIDLVYPGSTTGSENYSSEPPLGPLAIYSSLPEAWRAKARFLDSTLLDHDGIVRAIRSRRADVVAMSCTTFNYSQALELAAIAKEHGAHVIFGGIHVTHLYDRILRRMQRREIPVDYLVTGYGEPAFYPLLRALSNGDDPAGTPNLFFVRDGEIIRGGLSYDRSGEDPLPVPMDYSQVDFRQYSARFRRIGNLANVRIAASIFTQRGCAYAGKQKCTFCSIEQVNPHRSQDLVEQDITQLIVEHNADHIRIDDGDFTVSTKHMARVAEAVEAAIAKTGRRPSFYCFTRADEIDNERVGLFHRMNIVSVFIGYESGSNRMLRSMHKFTTSEQNLEATERLRDAGIDVTCAGIVLGAEGESEKTLAETMTFVKQLAKIGNVRSLVATPLIPLPGSPSFARLLELTRNGHPGFHNRLMHADSFEIDELIYLWNKHACQSSIKRLLATADEIADVFEIGIRFLEFDNGRDWDAYLLSTSASARVGDEVITTNTTQLHLPIVD